MQSISNKLPYEVSLPFETGRRSLASHVGPTRCGRQVEKLGRDVEGAITYGDWADSLGRLSLRRLCRRVVGDADPYGVAVFEREHGVLPYD